MASNNPMNYFNIIDIKQEMEPIHDQPVIVQNFYVPESVDQTFKSEPEEHFCMEIEDQKDTSFVNAVKIEEESQNFLKIASVTQGFNADQLGSKKGAKRGRKPKNIENLKVMTKMKPAKKVQKSVKNAVKLDKNLNKIQKSRKIDIKIEEQIDDFRLNSDDFGEIEDNLLVKPTKGPKIGPKSIKKPTKSASNPSISKKSASNPSIFKKTSKNPKISQFFHPNEQQTLNSDSSKIPIQKSQTSPSKIASNSLKTPQKATNNLKSPQNPTIKSEPTPQTLQSSFILDSNNTKQLKLKISKNSTNIPKKPKKQPQTAPQVPDIKHESLPADSDHELINYDPKITKKRKEIRLECDNCDKVFKSKYSIIWHMKEHMLTMPFNCKICGKGFSYERSFKQHELTHAAKIDCEICGKSLKPHAMYYHMKYRHTNEKTHQCPQCPKAFKTKDNIIRHMMRHNMKFPCNICGRKFAENSRLQMHLNMHENPDDFLCTICNKSFEHIDRHMKRLHAKKRERNLKCQYCEYASDSKQTLRRHEEMHEKRNEILQSKTRKRKIKLKIMDMKTFECKVCNVVLQTKSGYKSHLRHYHDGKEPVRNNEIKDESSMENDNFIEIKVEKEEVRAIQ
ncbi:zinc finger protein 23-like [Chironomus tepperi]|uniref:zinc finger protein 23-like n=1 Tax=Chironomus tepperi TaxID=113505 RepID=UPI00391FA4BC